MNFLKNVKMLNVLKVAGLAVVVIVVVAIAFRLIGSSVNSLLERPGTSGVAYPGGVSYGSANGPEMDMMKYGSDGSVGLSMRNVATEEAMVPPVEQGTTVGDTAEQFEVTEYGATVETRDLDSACATVVGLKSRDYVIFESASEYDHGCDYVFKVKRANVEEILGIVRGMNPRDFSENTYTIKSTVDDFTAEEEILKGKLASIDDTLAKAVGAYDEVTGLATRVRDVESLAKVIDSKINLIERLTQDRINVNYELERIGRAKAEQLDRLEYTYFRVNIYEDKLVDGENLRDSWKQAVREFVQDVNDIAQDVSVNLVSLSLRVLQFALYALILLVAAKYGWRLARYIWKR